MKQILFLAAMLFSVVSYSQIGVQLTNQDAKVLAGWDEPNKIGAQAVATLSYNWNNQLHFGVKTGVYINYDHLISIDLKFLGQEIKGQMATLEYHYNITNNLLIGIQLNTQRVGVSAIYMLPSGNIGSGCY